CIVRKVNDIRLNRQFVETDDEEEADQLLSSLVKAHRKTVFDAVESQKGNHPDIVVDPDAITNDTFLKALEKRKHIGEPEKLVGWLVTAAKNLTIDKIRRTDTQTRRLPTTTLDRLFVGEREALYDASRRAETDAAQTGAYRYREEQLLRLLTYMDKDREIVVLARDERLNPAQIAERVGSTAEAVQKRQERLIKWTNPVMQHLDALIDCLPNEKDRNVMERYFLDQQSFSEITEALGISRSTIEETVKRVIKDWKKTAKDNPTDPVSAMVKKEG
ncbi:sigma-70 family RNA polymerase sigma factor, partial [Candidatus Poribacteria bacterium]|nr:sigma-70 family RNA polymerase sigma factor [Candidatus Poribacteria bacterium]